MAISDMIMPFVAYEPVDYRESIRKALGPLTALKELLIISAVPPMKFDRKEDMLAEIEFFDKLPEDVSISGHAVRAAECRGREAMSYNLWPVTICRPVYYRRQLSKLSKSNDTFPRDVSSLRVPPENTNDKDIIWDGVLSLTMESLDLENELMDE